MKVALVHDYLREYGGAERVVEAMHEIWPDAPLYTSFVDWGSLGEFAERFKNWDIRTSWVDRNSLVKKWHSPLRFLTPLIWESLDVRGFDVIISSSGWYICRGIVTRPEQLHISYIHHPPRNLYGYPTGRSQSGLTKIYAAMINPFLRMYDFATAQRVDCLVANSEETRSRIKKFYRRDATVIYPPVDVNKTLTTTREKDYFLSVGRLTYAKRIDVIIKACNELQLPLKIVGTGREEAHLRSLAGPTIEFVGGVSDAALTKLYAGAKALIFCALQEDFGIVPVEAMGHGVPVIALRQGGVKETVVEDKTGVFFATPEKKALVEALQQFMQKKFDTRLIHKHAQLFAKEVFQQKMSAFVKEQYLLHQKTLK